MRNGALAEFLERRGATKRLAEACGVSHAAVSQWRKVPERHLNVVAAMIGTTPDALRGLDAAADSTSAPARIPHLGEMA